MLLNCFYQDLYPNKLHHKGGVRHETRIRIERCTSNSSIPKHAAEAPRALSVCLPIIADYARFAELPIIPEAINFIPRSMNEGKKGGRRSDLIHITRKSSHPILPTKEQLSRVHLHKDAPKTPHVYAEVIRYP